MIALAGLVVAGHVSLCPRCMGPDVVIVTKDPTSLLAGPQSDPDGTSFVVTQDGGACENYVNYTSDRGLSWSGYIRLDLDPVYVALCGAFAGVVLRSDGVNNAYFSWVGSAGGSGPPMLLSKTSPDRGATWPPAATIVAPLPIGTTGVPAQVIAAPGGNVWLFWVAGASIATRRTYVSRSSDGGASWSPPVQVDLALAQPGISFCQAVEDGIGGLVVFLKTNEAGGLFLLWSTRSGDGGQTWSTPLDVDGAGVPVQIGLCQALVPVPGQVLVTWNDNRSGNTDEFSRVSVDGGQSWILPVVRVDEGDAPGAAESRSPVMVRAGPGPEVAMAWPDVRDGPRRAYGNFSLDGGVTWGDPPGSPAFPISAFATGGLVSNIRLSGHKEGWVTAVWGDPTRDAMARCGKVGCNDTYMSTSCDGGRTWDPDTLVLDWGSGVNVSYLATYPGAADGLVYDRVQTPFVRYFRLDGPAVASSRGPTTYCLGSDPLLDADAVSSACLGGLQLQWYVDGVAVPGATGPTYQPALAAGDHVVEVQATCASSPTCTPGSVPVTLRVRAPMMPPDVGNSLRVTWRTKAATPALSWALVPTLADVHFHVRRAFAKTDARPWTLVSPDPALVLKRYEDTPPASQSLVFYEVRQADVCETESGN